MDPHPYGTLDGHDTEELFILVFLLIDAYITYRTRHRGPYRQSNNCAQPPFTDAEVLTIALVGELKGRRSERSWFHEVRTDWAQLFLQLISRSRYLRRKMALAPLLEQFRRCLVEFLGLDIDPERFIDSKPVILAHYRRARFNDNRRFRPRWLKDKASEQKIEVEPGMADIGRCATKQENYFGMKLHLMMTLGRVPTSWCLTPASVDDRKPVMELIEADSLVQRGGGLRVWGDSGYVSEPLAQEARQQGHEFFAFPKGKKREEWPRDIRKMLAGLRQGVETDFSEGKRFLNLEQPGAATTAGLMARMAAKMTALTLYLVTPALSLVLEAIV